MVLIMLEPGWRTKFMEKEYTLGEMDVSMMVSGRITIWTDQEFILGKMVEDMKENI